MSEPLTAAELTNLRDGIERRAAAERLDEVIG